MNDDDLARAIAALREEGERPAPQARMTRERILRDLRPRARSRRWVVGIPLAALLLGGTVLAATGRLPEVLSAATRAFGLGNTLESGQAVTARARSVSSVTKVLDEAPAPLAPVAEAAPEPVHDAPSAAARPGADAGVGRGATRRARLSAAPTPSLGSGSATAGGETPLTAGQASSSGQSGSGTSGSSGSSGAPGSSEPPARPGSPPDGEDALALYRRAHQIHFVEQNPAGALVAWDAYLASDPHGALAVDARYDRALCLVRLGRKAEARRALEPFAAGKYGAFRQSDARALIDAMGAATP